MIKISIIVPVYNAAQYLSKCLDSIIKQTYKNIEIILINDGSTDDSGKICDAFADNDVRIIVIHNDNHGVSYSRNCGIKIATGDWLMFVDCDDYIDLQFVEKMIKPLVVKKYDFILCRCNYVDSDGCCNDVISKLDRCSSDLKKDYWLLLDFIGGPVMKLYRMSVIKENKLYFPENISYSEDRIFNTNFYRFISGYYFVNEALYFIVNRNVNSLSKQILLKNFMSAVMEVEFTSNFLKEYNYYYRSYVDNNRIIDVISAFAKGSDYTYCQYKEVVENLIRLIHPNKDGVIFKRKLILKCLSSSWIYPVYFWYRYRSVFKLFINLKETWRRKNRCTSPPY